MNELVLGSRVIKKGGSFQHTGTIVSIFNTIAGEQKVVLEFDAPINGMLHIYRPDQVELLPIEPISVNIKEN